MWTSQEKDAIWKKWCDYNHLDDIVRAERLASFAVEIVAARGETVPEDMQQDMEIMRRGMPAHLTAGGAQAIARLVLSLRATVATLHAKVGEMETVLSGYESANTEIFRARSHLRAEVEGLKQELEERDELERQTMKTVTGIWAARAAEVEALHTKTREHLLDKEEECKRLSAEVEMLKAEGEEQRRLAEGLSGRIDLLTRSESMAIEAAVAAESRLAAIRERAATIRRTRMGDGEIDEALYGTGDKHRVDRLIRDLLSLTAWLVLEGDAPQEATSAKACAAERIMPDGCGRPVRCTGRHTLRDGDHISAQGEVFSDEIARFPCSPTCTHDDAARPGHPERAASLSLTISEQATAQNGAWNAMHPNGSCTCGGEGTCAWCAKSHDQERVKEMSDPFQNAAPSLRDPRVLGTERRGDVTVVKITPALLNERERREYERGKDAGAEAMRAACIEKAVEWAQVNGLSVAMQKALKDALEGVAT